MAASELLDGGGECGALVRGLDWAATPLGAVATWPEALRTMVANLLHARQPMLLFWGPELIQLYNDSFVPSFGRGKHPAAMGQRAVDCWADAWPVVGAQIEAVMSRGEPAWHEDTLVPIFRNGRMEEVFWTYSYSPAYSAGGIHGTLVIVTEVTGRVLAARRQAALTALGVALVGAQSGGEVLAALVSIAEASPADLPILVVRDASGATVCTVGIAEADVAHVPGSPGGELRTSALAAPVACRAWPEPITLAASCTLGIPAHTLSFGLSPRLAFDPAYAGFLGQVAEQVGSTLRRLELGEQRARVVSALEDAGRAKDEFLAMLGHELRNPLAPIVTALELMNRKDGDTAQERAVIDRQLRHVIRLVDDLLDISRITRGLVTLETATVELADIVIAAIQNSAVQIEQRGHTVEVDAPRGICVIGDEARLLQIVSNLVTNAVRYTPTGGWLRVTVSAESGQAVIRVSDNGTGIDPNDLPRMFDMFVQGPRSPDRREGGLGLGLAIVKNLVTLHGGTVAAQSAGRGKGSTFTVRVALAEPAASRSVAAPGAPRMVDARRVLIVDDNQDAADLLGEIARMKGHDVTIVHDPVAALGVAPALAPEVAVLDIGLPGMDGYELAERLRAICPRCRLIALSGYGQDKDRERSRLAGFDAHLVKPVRVETLLDLLAR